MKRVLLLLAKGFEMYEASVFTDVIGWNLIDGDGSTDIKTCGTTKEIISAFGVRVTVDYIISEVNIDDFDALALPGGFSEYGFYEDAYSEDFLQLIREFNKRNKIIASICVGALPLGKSGILLNRRATTYNMKNGIRQDSLREFGAIVLNEPIVTDGNVITCWSPVTAIEVAYMLLELLTDNERCDYIRKIMGFKLS